MKWDKLCLPREEGGLGFRMIHEFNLALLGKQLWGLIQYPDSLVARVLREKYFRCSSPLWLNKTSNPSYGWTSIMEARTLMLLGIRQKYTLGMKLEYEKTFGCLESHQNQLDLWKRRSLVLQSLKLSIGRYKLHQRSNIIYDNWSRVN